MKLEHVAINVTDPAQLAQWLVDNLGMRIVVASKESPYMHFVADEEGSMIELYNNPAAPVPDYSEINPFNLHFAYASNDIETDRARLVACRCDDHRRRHVDSGRRQVGIPAYALERAVSARPA